MIRFYIGDHCHHRLQMQERGIALVCFSHQIATATQLGISAGAVYSTAHDKSGVAAIFCQDRRYQAGGGGLAMGAGNGDTVTVAHQFGEHLGAPYNRNTLGASRGNLGIFNGHCGGLHHHIGTDYIGFTVTDKYGGTGSLQTLNTGSLTDIGTGNFITLIK